MQTTSPRLHSLDGLRAIAACLVVVHHLGATTLGDSLRNQGQHFFGTLIPSITASGVELFFVLSAVVLTKPYVTGRRPMRLGLYLGRRVERLWPPFIAAWLLAGAAVYVAGKFPTWQTINSSNAHFEVQSWLLQLGIVYFGANRLNPTWWSLGVEVAFYAIVPALIVLFSKAYAYPRMLAIVFCAAVAVAEASSAAGRDDDFQVISSLIAYASCFCAGLTLACSVPNRRTSLALIIFGLFWVFAASSFSRINMHVGWGLFYFGIVSFALRPNGFSAGLSRHGFVWLGERSYSLFLVHYSVIITAYWATSQFLARGASYFLVSRIAAVIGSLIAAMLVFRLVEKRFARNLVTGTQFFPWSVTVPQAEPHL